MSYLIAEVSSEDFQTVVLESTLPVLVEFSAEWCPPCKMIAPFLDDLAQKYQGKLTVSVLDVDAHPDIMQRYGVLGIPTLILFQNGEPMQRIVGFKPRERLEAFITPYLALEHTT